MLLAEIVLREGESLTFSMGKNAEYLIKLTVGSLFSEWRSIC